MEHVNNLLARGARPVVGRMFEAGAAENESRPDAGLEREPVPHRAHPAPPASSIPVLPFIGTVNAFAPHASITVTRCLTIEHDLHLADHHFVHAPGVKLLAACFPVLPMTVSLEAMAETAACLAPGQGLIGFKAVTARRWIALDDGAALTLRIEGRVLDQGGRDGPTRIAVRIFTGDTAAPAIDATVCFASQHAHAQAVLAPCTGGTARDAGALYRERHLFHGPRFQAMAGPVQVGVSSASTTLLVRGAGDWFAGERQPQLLTDPALLDGVGQLAAVWAMQHGRVAFPIGLDWLELHGPTPPPGSHLPIRLHIVDQQGKMLAADVEIGDGRGGLWARIGGWKCWQFEWAPQLVAFQRQPAHTLLSEAQQLTRAAGVDASGVVCRRLGKDTLKNFDLALLARHYLHASEWPAFAGKAKAPERQREWLLGRICAKDAARTWRGGPGLHPAAFAIDNDEAGQPLIALWPPGPPAPAIAIAHTGGQAVAVASGAAVGIDIEKIAARDAHCVDSFCTALERALLTAVAPGERDAWITRLWCAKEAFGKRLGIGVAGGLRQFEAQNLAPDFSLSMRHTWTGVDTRIHTLRDGELIIAVDLANPVAAAAHPAA